MKKAIKIASATTGGTFVLVVFIGLIGSSAETVQAGKPGPATTAITTTADAPLPPAATTATPTKPAVAPTTDNKQAAVPVEYRSALKTAESYVDLMHMSKQGVYDQLTSEYGEKFSAAAAQYAVDNVKADWNAQALASAKSYQNTMHMSPSAIRDQLTSEYGEKFTKAEADYAIAHLNE
ncbi:Ltp family lipoprotein [Lentzea sp. NPDC005914]|uniref:Ltp family lipoprotein n=1 Tax=Lentzea sp. NPDC005914 TaxID=3154572 RepID=UPI0033E7C9D3